MESINSHKIDNYIRRLNHEEYYLTWGQIFIGSYNHHSAYFMFAPILGRQPVWIWQLIFTWSQLSSTSVLILCFHGIIISHRDIFTTTVSFWSLTLMTQPSIPAFVTQTCVVRLACSMFTGFRACTPCRYTSSNLTMISLKARWTTTLIYPTTASTIQTWNNTLGYKKANNIRVQIWLA